MTDAERNLGIEEKSANFGQNHGGVEERLPLGRQLVAHGAVAHCPVVVRSYEVGVHDWSEEVDFEEITTDTDRRLTIGFSAGTEQIEIIGTFVIPEFGTIAAMILAVAIISIVAISAKSKLNMFSRY